MARRGGVGIGLIVGVVVAVLAGVGLGFLPGGFGISNPFKSETKTRDQSALLVDLRDLNRFEAASGQFQVFVDVEKDVKYLPSWVAGEHVTFIAEGEVEAVVDFSGLTSGAVRPSKDKTSVTITLPPPTLTKPRIDPDNSRVTSNDKGLANRVAGALSGGRDSDQALYQTASKKIAASATKSELLVRAERNTRKMLTALLKDLGFDRVKIIFRTPVTP